MEPDDILYTEHFEPVPEIFRSTETGRPFERCAMCDRFLLDAGTTYIVEKAFRSYKGFDARETVFEYALCTDCRDSLTAELSTESRQRIQDYFESRVDIVARRHRLVDSDPSGVRLGPWISRCLVSDEPVGEMDEFQVYCECDGPHMLYGYSPFLLGGKVMDQIADLLSNKTLDELNGFADDILGLPPELEELFARRVVLL